MTKDQLVELLMDPRVEIEAVTRAEWADDDQLTVILTVPRHASHHE